MTIIVTGNPGVGKHTIAKKLSERMEKPILDLNQIAIEKKIYERHGSTLDVDVEKLASIIKKSKTDSIVIGHLAPYALAKSQVRFVIVLRKSPYKLIPIYKKRKYSQDKINQNVASEILGIISYDAMVRFGKGKTFEIDSTGLSPDQVVNKIGLVFKHRFKSGKIDWLDMVAKKGELSKFFPDK